MTELTNSYFTTPEHEAPAPQPKAKRKWLVPALVAGALVLGGAIGFASQPAPKTVTVTEEKIVTKEVAKTPKECRQALDLGNEALGSAGATITILSDALGSAARLDAAAMQRVPAKVDAQTQILKGLTPRYTAARSACLASE